jgi:biotin carboxyl carrier protein
MSGNIWKILIAIGDQVQEGDEILVMEAMKMEMPVVAPVGGRLAALNVKEGDPVEADSLLAVVTPA